MLLEVLRLQNIRNLTFVELEPHERFNIFAGANGQGKTNLLEAIYLLSAIKSFRTQTTNTSLIQFGQDRAILEARVDRGGHERIVKIDISERGKKVFLNESPVRALADFFGTLNVVVFGPEDISLLKGAPSERRRFIDRAIFNAHPAYATEMSHYDDILKNRNALLRENTSNKALLSVYNDQFIDYASDIVLRRMDFIEHFKPVLHKTFKAIFDDSFEASLDYAMKLPFSQPSLDKIDKLSIEGLLEQALDETKYEERDRGFTLVGPHRDDIDTFLNGHDVKSFASQGQHRAFVLAMKIAEITYLEERYHFAPILLLDDVSSELDRERNRFLFDFLRQREQGQVFISTTHRDHILLDKDLRIFNVNDGIVIQER